MEPNQGPLNPEPKIIEEHFTATGEPSLGGSPITPPTAAPIPTASQKKNHKSNTPGLIVVCNFLAFAIYVYLFSLHPVFVAIFYVHIALCLILGVALSFQEKYRDYGKGFLLTLAIPFVIGVTGFALCAAIFSVSGY